MKKLSLVLLIAGIVLGPAYWIYAKFYTGQHTASLALSRSGDGGWRSPNFTLREDMAPLGMILSTSGSFAPNMDEFDPPSDRYAATLYKDGVAGQTLTFTLNAKSLANSNPVFKEHLLLLKKLAPGEYHMVVTPMTPPRIHHDQMLLQVRQNLHEPDNRVVISGILMFVLGILGLLAL